MCNSCQNLNGLKQLFELLLTSINIFSLEGVADWKGRDTGWGGTLEGLGDWKGRDTGRGGHWMGRDTGRGVTQALYKQSLRY